jgi:hypothetical protein
MRSALLLIFQVFIGTFLAFCLIATAGTGGLIHTTGGQTYELYFGTSPTVTALAGNLFVDTDDFIFGMSDGSNEIAIGQKIKVVCPLILNPDLVGEATNLPLWSNATGMTYMITQIEAYTDVTGSQVDLFYIPDRTDFTTGRTAIDSDVADSAGTGVFYNVTTSLDSSTVANGGMVTWDQHGSQVDCEWLQIILIGELRAP